MILSEISIRRPIFAIVFSVLLLVFGIICFYRLPVRELPNTDFPSVSISTTYAGATPEITESKITKVIEDELSGIAGVKTIISTSRNGKSWVSIEFEKNIDMLEAISDVRDSVSRARKKLPKDVDEPIVTRDNGEGEVVLWLNLSSNIVDRVGLSDYVNRYILKNINLIDGVSQIQLVGAQDKVMYVHLNPTKMMSLGITVGDVITAIGYENVELPSGEMRDNDMYFPVEIKRIYINEKSFLQLPIKHSDTGNLIRLRDVAKVEIRAKNAESVYHRNGVSSIGIGIIPQSTANPLEVSRLVQEQIKKIQPTIQEGINLAVDFDSTIYIKNSINEVYETLLITSILVIIVLYFFIGSWRTTLIPSVTVPISIISSFIGAYILGFSINLITLLSLILAIGLVVDDAIVMVENISFYIKRDYGILAACWQGAKEVGFAIIATTVVLIMIFMPITFMQGNTGALFVEFAVLLSLAVFSSSIIALTLSPALSSIILKDKKSFKQNRLIQKFGSLFSIIWKLFENNYEKLLKILLKNLFILPAIVLALILGIYVLYKDIPHQFVPHEDRGVVYVYAVGQEGTSIHRMKRNMLTIEEKLLPYIDKKIVKSISFSTPSLGKGNDQTGFVVLQLVDWGERNINSLEFVNELKKELMNIPDLKIFVYEPGFKGSSKSPIRYILKGGDYKSLNQKALSLVKKATEEGIIVNADTNYSENTPEIEVTINAEKASWLGVSLTDISKALKTYLGGTSYTSFEDKGEEYDVYLKADDNKFTELNQIRSIGIRAHDGTMVDLGSIADFSLVAKAKKLPHFERRKAITISATPAPNISLGEALIWMDKWSEKNLTSDMSVSLSGESKNFRESENDLAMVMSLAILITFLVLAAQFESFVYPIIVMVTIPLAIFGGLLGLFLTEQSINIYSQIGLLLLIGMATKNGILIVEFTNQLRIRGYNMVDAIIKSSVRRLRPILMTSITAIIGALPLLFATGSGYESRESLGSVIFYGMFVSTIITLVMVPLFYYCLAKFALLPGNRIKQLEQELKELEKLKLE
ncbi:MAG: efflux RND transporter permease subunit [Succinivibrionaceae bacterium]